MIFTEGDTQLGDGRQGFMPQTASGNAESNQQKINLTKISTRLSVNAPVYFDGIFQWWIIHTQDSSYTTALFTADLDNQLIVAPVYSVKTAYTERAIASKQDIAKQFKILARGSKYMSAVKTNNPFNGKPYDYSIKPSYTFGKNGKIVNFDVATDNVGDLGNIYLITCFMNTSGIPGSGTSFNGINTVYFTDVIGQ